MYLERLPILPNILVICGLRPEPHYISHLGVPTLRSATGEPQWKNTKLVQT